MGQNKFNEDMQALDGFVGQGLIAGVLGVVKSGKEATVFCCEGAPQSGAEYFAAKVYRTRDVRNFRNDAVYNAGRLRNVERRVARAIETKTSFGREAFFAKWVADEYETLRLLHRAGCDVPEPMVRSERVIIMEYIGDDDGPAPVLSSVRLSSAEANIAWEHLLRNVEIALSSDRIHGDLSAYNLLYNRGRLRVIDFPQAIDARFNTNALSLLERDLENVYGYFERMGVDADPRRIARELWGRYLRSDL